MTLDMRRKTAIGQHQWGRAKEDRPLGIDSKPNLNIQRYKSSQKVGLVRMGLLIFKFLILDLRKTSKIRFGGFLVNFFKLILSKYLQC